MSSATTLESEVDDANLKKLSSSEDTKAHLNPDAAVFETGSLSKDVVDKQEVETNEEPVAEMPSPQPIASPPLSGGGGITVNGNEPSVFSDAPGNPGITRQSIPDHIKPDQLSKEELRSLVRQQLEYYFSRENLAGDTYLVSQMDSDQYVLIQIVANFNQMKKLTSDIELVKEAIRESAYLQMDDSSTKMRPNMKRCIVILREVPDSTSVEEVEELFSGEGCPKYISCEPAHNNYWYIQFESEEGAQKAYRYLREDIKTFKGKPIMARIKAKPIPRASTNFVPKNGVRPPSEPNSMPAPPFRFPVSPVYSGHQPYSFFPPTMVSQWAAGQHYFDPTLIPNLSSNAYHTPHNFNKINTHQGNRPYYQTNRNRNQTRSYREQSERIEKDSSPPYRPRAHSTNGTSNTTTSTTKPTSTMNTVNTSNNPNWRRTDDEYRPGPRMRRRRGSSEDIRTSRSPVPQEPPRSKDDSFQINLTSSQFPPLPSANVFNTAELPLQSPNTRQDYNKVASSPPISPPVTPTKIVVAKQEETWKKPSSQTNDTDFKKEDTKKVDTKMSEPKPDTKNNTKSTPADQKKEATAMSEKLSYAQIAQKKGQLKVNQQPPPVSTTASTTTTGTVTTVAQTVSQTVAQS